MAVISTVHCTLGIIETVEKLRSSCEVLGVNPHRKVYLQYVISLYVTHGKPFQLPDLAN